ncbi:MAG: flavodoxin family protein [Anaerolineae bacterium]|nr:flavodoxin family protein [Anaerolineae bacterium]
MNIGILVYSHTGHTLNVARKLQEQLSASGHMVTLAQLETVVPLKMGDTTASLKTIPPVDTYDALVFACPVRGGTPAPPMRVYLEQITSLEGKKVACLVTGFFPAKWGRNQTLAQMKTLCESKGATVCGLGSVWWSFPGRKQKISMVVDHLSQLFFGY